MQPSPTPARRPGHLGGGARALAGGIVLGGSVLGTLLAFYGTGVAVDALIDRGTLVCGETVGCGFGTGFLVVVTGVLVLVLAAVGALVLAFALPPHWTSGRALRFAGWVAGGAALLATGAMLAVWLSGAGGEPPG